MYNVVLNVNGNRIGLEDDVEEEFLIWCFGEEFAELIGSPTLLKKCNEMHGDELIIHDHGYVEEDLGKMFLLWVQHQAKYENKSS